MSRQLDCSHMLNTNGSYFQHQDRGTLQQNSFEKGRTQSPWLRQMFTGAFDFSVPAVAWPKNPVLSSSLLLRWELQFFGVNFFNWIDSEIEVVKSGSRKFQKSFSSLVLRWEVQTFFLFNIILQRKLPWLPVGFYRRKGVWWDWSNIKKTYSLSCHTIMDHPSVLQLPQFPDMCN